MLKTIKKAQSGFTIIELLIVMAIIVVLAGVVLVNFQGAQAKARDTQRVSNVGQLQAKLEEYYNNNSGYPNTFTATTLTGIEASALNDPKGRAIVMNAVVADKTAADGVAAPTAASTSDYLYVPYGTTGCTTTCTGYEIKSYIEKPTTATPNPYIKYSLN